jgi:hypothetical protein
MGIIEWQVYEFVASSFHISRKLHEKRIVRSVVRNGDDDAPKSSCRFLAQPRGHTKPLSFLYMSRHSYREINLRSDFGS